MNHEHNDKTAGELCGESREEFERDRLGQTGEDNAAKLFTPPDAREHAEHCETCGLLHEEGIVEDHVCPPGFLEPLSPAKPADDDIWPIVDHCDLCGANLQNGEHAKRQCPNYGLFPGEASQPADPSLVQEAKKRLVNAKQYLGETQTTNDALVEIIVEIAEDFAARLLRAERVKISKELRELHDDTDAECLPLQVKYYYENLRGGGER
jgi:hypothetical protein